MEVIVWHARKERKKKAVKGNKCLEILGILLFNPLFLYINLL